LTGTVTDSHQGGRTGARLRWAGFDGIVLRGRSETPVYLFIEDGRIEIRDASDVWGMGIHDTVAFFQARYGKKNLSVNAIGPAGETLCRYATWVNEDDRAFGRGGTGAVGGAKKLKAIVIRAGIQKSRDVDRDAWKRVRREALDTIRDEKHITSPRKGGLSVYGTNVLMNATNSIGALGVRNSQFTSFGDRAEALSGVYVKDNILVGDPTCHACPVACKKEVEIKSGPWAGLRMESVEYEPAWSLGSNCDNDDINSVAKMIDQCNDLGMDPIELGNALSMYMEATEKGGSTERGSPGVIPRAWSRWSRPLRAAKASAICSRKDRRSRPSALDTPKSRWRARDRPSPLTTRAASREWDSAMRPAIEADVTCAPTSRRPS